MMVFKDMRCPNGHIHEYYVNQHLSQYPCLECGLEAKQVHTACNFALEGTSGDFPTAAQKWERRHTI
jgi:hypothetical protein